MAGPGPGSSAGLGRNASWKDEKSGSGADELVTGTVEIACVNMTTMTPAPIPDFLYAKLEALK